MHTTWLVLDHGRVIAPCSTQAEAWVTPLPQVTRHEGDHHMNDTLTMRDIIPSNTQTERDHKAGRHKTWHMCCDACDRREDRFAKRLGRHHRWALNNPAIAVKNIARAADRSHMEEDADALAAQQDEPWF